MKDLGGHYVFVHPSLEETFGNVLIEAIVEGVPVIGGTRSGAVPWVLGNGSAGLLVDVTSASSIEAAILRLTADDEARMQLTKHAFDYIEANFSLQRVVDLYEAEYGRILAL